MSCESTPWPERRVNTAYRTRKTPGRLLARRRPIGNRSGCDITTVSTTMAPGLISSGANWTSGHTGASAGTHSPPSSRSSCTFVHQCLYSVRRREFTIRTAVRNSIDVNVGLVSVGASTSRISKVPVRTPAPAHARAEAAPAATATRPDRVSKAHHCSHPTHHQNALAGWRNSPTQLCGSGTRVVTSTSQRWTE